MNQCASSMNSREWFMRLVQLASVVLICQLVCAALGENEKAALSPRPAWNGSRVIGWPEPPPPYTVEAVFTQIKWKNPVFAIREPGSEWLVIVEWPQLI